MLFVMITLIMYLLVAVVVAGYYNVEKDFYVDAAWAMGVFWPIFLVRALYRGFMKVWKS